MRKLSEAAERVRRQLARALELVRADVGELLDDYDALADTYDRIMKFDPLYWWAGRLWGERIIALFGGKRKRGARYMGRVDRWGRKFTWPAVIIAPFLPIPNSIVYAVVGVAGMRLVTFIVLDLVGTALWVGLLIGLGYVLGQRAVNIAEKISHYSLWISIGLVAIVVAAQFRGNRRKS